MDAISTPCMTGLRFGPGGKFLLQRLERRLWAHDQPVGLGARAFDLLLCLAERPGQLLTKQALMDLVWPGAVVEENNLATQISSLRKLLGAELIATIPGHGYRFTAPVDVVAARRGSAAAGIDLTAPAAPAAQGAGPAAARHNLPAARDSFVGRETALRDLAGCFDAGARLVTLLGTAGTGKTRLALQFGRAQLGSAGGSVWFCDLSAARGLDGIVHAVAQGLDLPLGRSDPLVQIGQALAGRGPCLAILDNFEQVARDAERCLGLWLDQAPQARFLVTSREVLNMAGERTLVLPPLAADDAVALFVRRAAELKPGFRPVDADSSAIQALVKLLDGLPLAIELAAVRIRVMSPPQLLQRMGDRFRLLAGSGERHDRQATLRAALDWSWDLLSQAERAALAQLSVFEGGFSLHTAEAVLDLGGVDDNAWCVDLVQALLEKSLLRSAGDDRFDLLVSVREYAAEHLSTPGRFPGSGPAAMLAAQQRHWRFFGAWNDDAAIAAGAIETDNLVAASKRAALAGDGASAVGALAAAWAVLRLRGPYGPAIDAAARLRAMPALSDRMRATIDWVSGCALEASGQSAASRQHFDTALLQAEQSGDQALIAQVLCGLGELHIAMGQPALARGQLLRAAALGDAMGQPALQCQAHKGLGSASMAVGDLAAARQHFGLALAQARGLAERHWECALLNNLGNLATLLGHNTDARNRLGEALALARAAGYRRVEANTLCTLGLLEHLLGRNDVAAGHLGDALDLARPLGLLRLECMVLCNQGLVAAAEGDTPRALSHQRRALDIARQLGDSRLEGQIRSYLGPLLARQGQPDDARAELHTAATLLLHSGDQSDLGLVHCGLAETERLAGNPAAAAVALARATALADEIGAEEHAELRLALRRVRALLADHSPV